VPGREWVSNPDRRFDTIEIRAPLVRALHRAHAAILDDLPKAFFLEDGNLQRKDVPNIPERVLREALVNALMHRSYRDHGPIQIIRYSNRLEIRNPGHSLIAEEMLGQPGSETRNPKIAAVLHDLRFAENKGSGIRVMREQMLLANLSPPFLESDRKGNRFLVYLLFHHFLSADDLKWLGNFRDDGLTDEEIKALVFLREAGAINNAAFRDLNQVDTLEASKHLRRLCKVGLLEKRSTGADTYYEGTTKLMRPLENTGKSTELVGKPSELPDKPSELPGKPSEFIGKPSVSAVEHSGSLGLPKIPDDLRKRISALGGKSSRQEVSAVIRELCGWKPLTGAAIAGYLSRSEVYVRQSYLTPMIESGELRYVHPDEPNHPQQAYRTPVNEPFHE
jgi:ATP-dependent DNA helicase RecG